MSDIIHDPGVSLDSPPEFKRVDRATSIRIIPHNWSIWFCNECGGRCYSIGERFELRVFSPTFAGTLIFEPAAKPRY